MAKRQGYKDYYVAFVDILGFKNLIANSRFDEILDIYWHFMNEGESNPTSGFYSAVDDCAQDEVSLHIKNFNRALLKTSYQYFSDCIVIAVPCLNAEALAVVIEICNYLQESMFDCSQPVFLRGAITKGPLYINNKKSILFGKGLVDAYQAESAIAKYPRIIIAENVVKSGIVDWDNAYPHKLVKDIDGYYYINSLGRYLEEFEQNDRKWKHLNDYIEGVLGSYITADIREKYLWLENKVDSIMAKDRVINVIDR